MLEFSALADPTRFRIVELLAANGRMPVSRIGEKFAISAPAISQHLKVLRQANLVNVEVSAQQRIYTLNPAGITEIEHWTARVRRLWEARFDALDALVLEEHAKQTKAKKDKS